jgi:hypothetical protein
MATKEDLSTFEQNMATKEDLKALATKTDLLETDTKVDLIAKTTAYILENMATKEDFKAFATKTDLLETENRLQEQITGISQDMKSFKEEVHQEILLGK